MLSRRLLIQLTLNGLAQLPFKLKYRALSKTSLFAAQSFTRSSRYMISIRLARFGYRPQSLPSCPPSCRQIWQYDLTVPCLFAAGK
eukprot:scaffold109068_cov18-Tisochrysis_lutea.AAC.1